MRAWVVLPSLQCPTLLHQEHVAKIPDVCFLTKEQKQNKNEDSPLPGWVQLPLKFVDEEKPAKTTVAVQES